MPKVSIIIPTYNSEKFLDRTVRGVLQQSYKDWELIIVDDKSSDRTGEIIRNWEKQDNRICSIFLENNSGGPARPKNIGIQSSRGKYIAFCDHDDEWFSEKLQKELDLLKQSQNHHAFITCNSLIRIGNSEFDYLTPSYSRSDQLEKMLEHNFVHSCSSLVFEKEAFLRLGFFDESLKWSDDWDFYIRFLASGGEVDIVPEKLFTWHSQQASASKVLKPLMRAHELEYLLNKHKQLFLSHKNAYAKNLRSAGVLYCLGGDFKMGTKFIKEVKKLGYQSIKTKILLCAALFRSRFLFEKLLSFRRSVSGEVLDKA